jgi:hypothetical protein
MITSSAIINYMQKALSAFSLLILVPRKELSFEFITNKGRIKSKNTSQKSRKSLAIWW